MGEVRDELRKAVEGRLPELLDAAGLPPEGFVSGYSSKIPPGDVDEIIDRVRAGEKSKHIAAEFGCSPRTMNRVIAHRLHERGEYDAVGWAERKSERRREGWEHMKEVWAYRDAKAQEAAQAAAEQQERLEAAEREQRRLRAEARRESHDARRAAILRAQGLPTR